jgi:hypothetical protein
MPFAIPNYDSRTNERKRTQSHERRARREFRGAKEDHDCKTGRYNRKLSKSADPRLQAIETCRKNCRDPLLCGGVDFIDIAGNAPAHRGVAILAERSQIVQFFQCAS